MEELENTRKNSVIISVSKNEDEIENNLDNPDKIAKQPKNAIDKFNARMKKHNDIIASKNQKQPGEE